MKSQFNHRDTFTLLRPRQRIKSGDRVVMVSGLIGRNIPRHDHGKTVGATGYYGVARRVDL